MKLNRRVSTTLLIAGTVGWLGACGVGNDEDEAGSLTAFNVVPTAITLTGPNTTTCGGGAGFGSSRVYVFGGTAPYQIVSTEPDLVVVSKGTVEHPGEFFEVAVPATVCLTTIPVVVIDKWGRQLTVTVTSVRGTT